MKKLLSLLLALALLLSLVGCGTQAPLDITTTEAVVLEDTQQTLPPQTDPPETTQPQTTQPETTEPETTQPETTQPEVTVPETTQPKPTEPAPTEPAPTKPAPTEPEATEPPTTEPAPTEPEVTEPAPTEPPTTEPEYTEPEYTEPAYTEPEYTEPTQPEPYLDPDGSYTTAEDVALYIHLYGCLPDNFITKSQARGYGWKNGSLERYAPGKCIGGDRFYNREGVLPSQYTYYECDIDTLGSYSGRGAKRIVFTYDGLIYYTDDHYNTFTLLYGEP